MSGPSALDRRQTAHAARRRQAQAAYDRVLRLTGDSAKAEKVRLHLLGRKPPLPPPLEQIRRKAAGRPVDAAKATPREKAILANTWNVERLRAAGVDVRVPRNLVDRFGENLLVAAFGIPGGVAKIGGAVAGDVYSTARGKPTAKRTLRIGKAIGAATAEDLRHPLRNPGFTLLDVLAFGTAGASAAARASAATKAGRAARASGRNPARAALTRPGYEGGSLLRKPEPGTATLRVGDTTVERLLSRNPLVRPAQRAYNKRLQRKLDEGRPDLTLTPAALERTHSAEHTVGREIRARRRVEQDLARGPVEEMRRAVRRLDRGERAALAVVGIEGDAALADTAGTIARHIDTHDRFMRDAAQRSAQATGRTKRRLLAEARANRDRVAELRLAQKALKANRPEFRQALTLVRQVAGDAEQQLVRRGLLDPERAQGRLARIADVYRAEPGQAPAGAFYFPMSERYTRGFTTSPPPKFATPQAGETGVGRPAVSRYVPGLRKRFTGASVRSGRVSGNVAEQVADVAGRRVRLGSALDFYEQLRGLSTPARESGFQVPLRDTTRITPELREFLARMEERLPGSADDAARVTAEELRAVADKVEAPELRAAAIGADLDGVRWVDKRFIKDLGETSLRGPIERAADAINNPIRFLQLYVRPAYLLNKLGNQGMLAFTQGFQLPANYRLAVRSEKIAGRRVTALIDSGMGTSKAFSYAVPTGPGARINRAVAEFWTRLTDLHERRAAFYHEARRAGHRTPEQWQKLLTDETLASKRVEVLRRAKKNIVDYDSLTAVERNTIRRIVYFYPWVSRGTLWALRAAVEHPGKTWTLAQLARIASEQAEREFGPVPSWFRGMIAAGRGPDGTVRRVDPVSINTFATAAETGETLAQTAGNLLGVGSGRGGLGDAFTPALQLFSSGSGLDSRPGDAGLAGLARSTAPAQALRRSGVAPNLFGEPAKTYPTTGVEEAVGPFVAGGLYPRPADVGYLNKKARDEQLARLSPVQRARRRVGLDRQNMRDIMAVVYPQGLDRGKLPQPLRDAWTVKAEREASWATVPQGSPRFHRRRFQAELRLAARRGAIPAKDAAAALAWADTATEEQAADGRRWLSDHVFEDLYLRTLREARGFLEQHGGYGS